MPPFISQLVLCHKKWKPNDGQQLLADLHRGRIFFTEGLILAGLSRLACPPPNWSKSRLLPEPFWDSGLEQPLAFELRQEPVRHASLHRRRI